MNNRRDFLKTSLLGGLAVMGATGTVAAMSDAAAAPLAGAPKTRTRKGKSVMGLRCKAIPELRVAFVGLSRGHQHLSSVLNIEGTKVVALCDVLPKVMDRAKNSVKKAGRPEPAIYTGEDDWKKVCERDDVDLVVNSTPWELHVPIALYAMKCGKHVATEVPIAHTIDDCWALVDTAEQTQRHCMMLENCCYDNFELTTLNMARKGLFGEVFHGEGAYLHDLRNYKLTGYYKKWRLEYSKHHTGDPYPTHGLGPVSQIMNINHGDRFEYLTSMSTKQMGLTLEAERVFGKDSPDAKYPYKMGDITQTMIHTTAGHTILVVHDTSSPLPYDRIHKLIGTKGYAIKYPQEGIALAPNSEEFLKPEELKKLLKEYEHPLLKYIGEKARQVGGHGGMDFTMMWRLIYCLQNGLPLDQDVYDGVTWSCLGELSERSTLNRSTSVDVPDFTYGDWKTAKPWPVIDMQNIFSY